jgi:uncharacterized protein YdeI (YjbR/CyaY-like superfamily)
MTVRDDAPSIQFDDRAAWRAWLEANHASARGVHVVSWRPRTGRPRLEYEDAIEEALCFGWVDSSGGVVDDERSQLYFAPRRPRSVWAASNRARVERLAAAGLMTQAGLAAIERAKRDGSWAILDAAERMEVPADLAAALDERPGAAAAFAAFPPGARKMALAWIATARRPETRARRIADVADGAARNERKPS